MRTRWLVLGLAMMLGVTGWSLGRGRAGDAKPAAGEARSQIELTAYAQDFAMVREVRALDLTKGENRLRVAEVSRQLDPQSVLLRWQGEGDQLPQLLAQSYDLGVGDSNGLLKRYLGKEVEIVRYGDNGLEAERQQGRLMVESDGEVVVQTDGKFYVQPSGTVVAPANADVVTIPQLTVQAESPSSQKATLEVAYLTRGMSWSADYVATMLPQAEAIKLECWATVTNRTGVNYPNAKITLIAGTVNRAVSPVPRIARGEGLSSYTTTAYGAPAEAPNLEGSIPASVAESHAYRLAKPTTVVQEQMNRLLMLSSAQVPVIKDYNTAPPQLSPWDDERWGTPTSPQRGEVAVAFTFFNREADGLGAPLPQGTLRVYEADQTGTLRYAGASPVKDTPRDQKVIVTLARAFDVFTESRVVKTQRVNKRTVRKQVELVLHNEKKSDVTLRVVQGFSGRASLVTSSHKHVRLDAYRAQWSVPVPAGETVTLSYTVDLAG